MNDESGGKKVDQFWEIYMWERELCIWLSHLILSYDNEMWRDEQPDVDEMEDWKIERCNLRGEYKGCRTRETSTPCYNYHNNNLHDMTYFF